MTSYSRRINKKSSSDDTLFLNTIKGDHETWTFGYGGFPYDRGIYDSKNRVRHILSKLSYEDTNYWDDRSMYDSYDLKNVFQI